MPIFAGSVAVRVVPSTETFAKDMAAQILPPARQLGTQVGNQISAGIKQAIGDPLAGPLQESTRRQQSRAPRQGEQVAGAFAKAFQDRLKAAFASLPKAKIDADSSDADRKVAELRARLQELSGKTVGVDLDAGQALAEIEAIKTELDQLGSRSPNVQVKVDAARAVAELAAVQAEVDHLDSDRANVRVDANVSGALAGIGAVGIALAGLSSIPVAATLGAGILGLVPAFGAAGVGAAGLAAVAVPAISHIKTALDAQKQAQQQSVVAGIQAQSRALAQAAAQQQLSAAVRNAAAAQEQAANQVRTAEQQLTSAQVAETQAQRALTAARQEARRSLQDMANQVADAQLAVRQSTFDVADAQAAYNRALADPNATKDQRARAKLALDEAKQRLREQELSLKRLRADQAAADKAGVAGSNAVRSARQALQAANQRVTASERALAAARVNVARVEANSADQVASARRAVTQASLQGAAANSKLATSMAALSPAERALMRDWVGLRSAFSGWVQALEPDVLPVLAGGIDLVRRALPRLTPMVEGASTAVGGLIDDVGKAAESPFWRDLTNEVTDLIPTAITTLGHTAENVATGVAGIFKAFLPSAPTMLRFIEEISARFAEWGKNLDHSAQFAEFMDYVRKVAPEVGHDVAEIAGALAHVAASLSGLGPGALTGVEMLASLVAKMPPPLLQAIAAGWLAIVAAQKAVEVGQGTRDFLATVGFLSTDGAKASKELGGVSRAILRLDEGATHVRPTLVTFAGAEDGVAASSRGARAALLGLSGALVTVGAVVLASPLARKLHDALNGTSQDTNKLATALNNLGQSGKFNGALLQEFKGNVLEARSSIGTFQRDAKELVTPNLAAYVSHGFNQMFSWLPGVGNKVGELRGKFKDLDTALSQMVSSGHGAQAAAAFGQIQRQLSDAGISTQKINSLFPTYSRLVGSAAFQSQQFTQKLNAENAALGRNADQFANSQQEIIDFRTGLTSASTSLKANGQAFFGNSTRAIQNRQSVLSVARTLQNYSDNLVANNQVTDKNIARLRGQRNQLITLIEKFGVSKDKAEAYANQLVKIPKSVNTKLGVSAKGTFTMKGVSFGTNPFNPPGRAGGGLLTGPGSERSDSIVTRVSRNEFIVNAPATRRYLPLLAAINDEGNQGTPYVGKGYAGGGLVGGAPAPKLDWGVLPLSAILKDKYQTGYKATGSPAGSVLSTAAGSNQGGVDRSREYSTKQFALGVYLAIRSLIGGGGGLAMVRLAEKYIGYHEGAGNRNMFSAGIGRPAESWCMDFIDWLAQRTGNRRVIPWTASAPGAARAFGSAYRSGSFGVQPGDIAFFSGASNGWGGIGHVGIVERPTGGASFWSIEGNYGDRVAHVHRSSAVGYAHPRYPVGSVSGSLVHASPSAAKAWAQQSLMGYGWGTPGQYGALVRLWNRESGWRWNATNPSSGAYGIPQSLPASKMRSAGSDWRDNAATQIKWGLGYIAGRYGSPTAAWSHETRAGWYDQGGWLPPGPSLVYNGTGQPEAVFTSKQLDALAKADRRDPMVAEYHAHFDGLTNQMIQTQVRQAFHVMQIRQQHQERIGRPH